MATLWRVVLSVPQDRIAVVEAALEGEAAALASFEDAPGGSWRIEALFAGGADPADLRARIWVCGFKYTSAPTSR